MGKQSGVYCTSFCNQGHRLSDGKPVRHECYVLNTHSLKLEREGRTVEIKKMHSGRVHKGVK